MVRSATATKHEQRLSPSCCLARFSNGGLGPADEIALSSPACTQRSICRGAVLASRLDPPAFSGDKRGRSTALLRNIHYSSRTCQIFMRPRELGPDFPSRARRQLETQALMTSLFSVFCNFQWCMSVRHPSKCSEPMHCTISSICLQLQESQAAHSRDNFWEDAWTAFQAHSGSFLNAEFRSCSSRCWSLLWA